MVRTSWFWAADRKMLEERPNNSKLLCTAEAGLCGPHTFYVLLHIFFYMRKQTVPVLVIFSGDVLRILHFPVTLHPTLSLLNLSPIKL